MISEQQEFWNTEEQRLVYCRLRLLFAEAGRLYEKHKIGQDDSFNIFSVLLRESDEVNLHSRFLHALLDYREQKNGIRKNLKKFFSHIGIENFELGRERVEREQFNIDILIRNDRKTAVAIENKIYAADQDQQLYRYYKKLEEEGFKEIHMVYLTLDGGDPSAESLGQLDNKQIIKISYQTSKKSIRPWLKDCQKQAFDNFELREAIRQYRKLVQKLTMSTEKELKEAYMTELLNLLRKNKNLQVFLDLQTTIIDARLTSMKELWDEIDSALKHKIPELPDKEIKDREGIKIVSDSRIHKFVTKQTGTFGLDYRIRENTWLSIEAEHYAIWIGIKCYEHSCPEEYNKIKEALNPEGKSWQRWPVAQYEKGEVNIKNPTPKVLGILLDDTKRREFASEIAEQVKEYWDRMNSANLIQFKQQVPPS